MVTDSHLQQFQQNGFTIVPGFFTPREAAAMRLELERMEAAGLGRDVMPAGEKQNIHFIRLDELSSLFKALPFAPKVTAALTRLIGQPARLWLDQIFLKPAEVGAGNVWHEDNARFKVPDVTRSTGMWIAIHDAARANGTLELIPGSWRGSDRSLLFRQPSPQEEARAVLAEMAAGGAAFFNFGTLHCTRDNLSGAPRAAAAYHFLHGANLPDETHMGYGRDIPVTGPGADAFSREAGDWDQIVSRVLAGAS